MSTPNKPDPWISVTEIRRRTRNYIDKRRKGLVQSFRTPWPKLNTEFVEGYEWESINLLAGSSGSGKTSIVEQMINEGIANNPGQNIVALKYQFEMTDIQTGARELTGDTGWSIQELFSAAGEGELMSDEDFEKIENIHKAKDGNRIYQISSPRAVDAIGLEILRFYEYAKTKYGDDVRVLLMFDHALLIEGGKDDNTELDIIGNMAKMLLKIKKRVPCISFILTQLNGYIEEAPRRENGSILNFPIKRDIYGGKQLYFACDTVIIFMRPFQDGIKKYGPGRIEVIETDIFAHIIKNRFLKPNTIRFKTELERFHISEY